MRNTLSLIAFTLSLIAFEKPLHSEERYEQGEIHVTASYISPRTDRQDTAEATTDLKVAKTVAAAVVHYQKVLPEWWGVNFEMELTNFRISAKRGTGVSDTGLTSFTFDRGGVGDWVMSIEGDGALITSVLVHEMNHVFFASYFKVPLPRGFDEGAAQLVENDAYQAKAERLITSYAQSGSLFPFSELIVQKNYPVGTTPEETERLVTLFYIQSHYMAKTLVQKHGRRAFVDFLTDGCSDGDFGRALKARYGLTPQEFELECENKLRKKTRSIRSFEHLHFQLVPGIGI